MHLKKKKKNRSGVEHENIFCIENERDIFGAVIEALERGKTERQFTLIALQMFTILIEQA